ncbi:MAG: adenylate cyclase [Candidatus Solibacter sp.]|nr:adenylate cyclase [Candidatus Solibacter sp.]
MSAGKPGKETEIKLRCGPAREARTMLLGCGFRERTPRTFERNEVFDTDALALRGERKLLRLREYGEERILTYKGPPEAGPHKVREEIETRVEDAAAMRAILVRLGYEVVFRYEKYRAEYERDGGMAVVDETPVGNFIELEGEPEWIDRCAAAMGFTAADYITLSYASLYLEWCARQGVEPGHMEFASSGD